MADLWKRPEGDEWNNYRATVKGTSAFAAKGAPTVFMWLEWSVLLAAISYAEQRTDAWPFKAMLWILGIVLWGYFINFFSAKGAHWLPKKEFLSAGHMVSWIISLAATAGMLFFSFWLAGVFIEHPLG